MIFKALQSCPKLRGLKLVRCPPLEGPVLAALSSVLLSLTTLIFHDCALHGAALRQLMAALSEHATLRQFGIFDDKTAVDVEVVHCIADMLAANRGITTLMLSVKWPKASSTVADLLAGAIWSNPMLERLLLFRLQLDPVDWAAIFAALRRCTELKLLDLCECSGLCGVALDGLIALLNTLPVLTTLWIRQSSFHGAPLRQLTSVLTYNASLRELDLSHNNLDVDDARCVAELLCFNRTLTELDLSGNAGIGTANGALLASAMHSNETLLQLTMDDFGIEDGYARDRNVIAGRLRHNRINRTLDFPGRVQQMSPVDWTQRITEPCVPEPEDCGHAALAAASESTQPGAVSAELGQSAAESKDDDEPPEQVASHQLPVDWSTRVTEPCLLEAASPRSSSISAIGESSSVSAPANATAVGDRLPDDFRVTERQPVDWPPQRRAALLRPSEQRSPAAFAGFGEEWQLVSTNSVQCHGDIRPASGELLAPPAADASAIVAASADAINLDHMAAAAESPSQSDLATTQPCVPTADDYAAMARSKAERSAAAGLSSPAAQLTAAGALAAAPGQVESEHEFSVGGIVSEARSVGASAEAAMPHHAAASSVPNVQPAAVAQPAQLLGTALPVSNAEPTQLLLALQAEVAVLRQRDAEREAAAREQRAELAQLRSMLAALAASGAK